MYAREKHASRQIVDSETPSAETQWLVFAEDSDPANVDESDAYAALFAEPSFPATYSFPSGKTASLNNVAISDRDGERSWLFKVSYGVFEPKTEGETEYEFEVGLQDITVTQSMSTQSYTGGGRTAPNFFGGVNVDADGRVRGVQNSIGTFGFSLTKYWPRAAITQAYQLQLKALAGRYNDATFYGLPAGELRFSGARGRPQGRFWPISYRFEHNDNETSIAVGDITVVSKLGWQYLDIYRRTIVDTTAKKKIEVPHSAYVHTLRPGPGNFASIGIGT